LRLEDVGKSVALSGWVASNRDMGGVIFIDLRDRYGITQVVFDPKRSGEVHAEAEKLRGEWVVRVEGAVRRRPQGTRNDKIPTGEIEVEAMGIEVLNRSKTPPIEIRDDLKVSDDLRMEYRYLDLRRGKMQRVLEMRSRANQVVRSYFTSKGFVEVETPFMIKYTPGGARNFLVPSRLNEGCFYALAESPQLFKQLLMVAGLDRYFQIVRCFRDEDLRIDRQPEFTQVDVEMSFVEQDDVFEMIEGMIAAAWKECLGIDVGLPLDRVPYEESMRRWGNDKPDRRFGLEHADLTEVVKKEGGGGVSLMKDVVDRDGIVKGLCLPSQYGLSRAEIDKLEEFVKGMGAKGLARARVEEGGEWTQSPLAKAIAPSMREAINKACGARPGDLLFFQFGRAPLVHTVMANLRLHLGKRFGLVPEYGSGGKWDFLWVVDPPLFEWDEEEKKWVAAHHPFTRPHWGDLAYLETDPGRVRRQGYDLVLNGYEIAGGTIRIHDPETQKRVFKVLGISDEEADGKFGFLLDAFQYGAPPHGGIAVGWDRVIWLLTETEAMRDVYAFPKNQKGVDMMTGAPTPVDGRLLRELGIKSTVKE